MPTVGVLHEAVAAQLETAAETARHLKMVCSASRPDRFEEEIQRAEPEVLVVDMAYLTRPAIDHVERLLAFDFVAAVVVIYAFAARKELEPLHRHPSVRVLKSPVTPMVVQSSVATLIDHSTLRPTDAADAAEGTESAGSLEGYQEALDAIAHGVKALPSDMSVAMARAHFNRAVRALERLRQRL